MEKQNKPDWKDVPNWAEWIAQDEDGEYWAYETEPDAGLSLWRIVTITHKRIQPIGFYPITRQWEATKERRPTASTD